jgi:acyl-coenzyme A synthetase/AMP-(fatty) acid ligase
MIEHKALANLCFWHNKKFSVTAADCASIYAGMSFDASVWEIFPYLIVGAQLCVVPDELRLDVNELTSFFQKNNVTISFLPTQIATQFLYVENKSLRYLLTGGDKLTSFVKKNYQLVNNYGPTENTVVTTSYVVENDSFNIPIGRPNFNTEVYILDELQNLVPPGIAGEICIGGASLARGYLSQQELTGEKFIANPFKENQRLYKTGDLGRWLPNGNIEFIGRKDFQFKINGHRIEPGEIEAVLLNHNDIESAVVISRQNSYSESELIAYITSPQTPNTSEIREYLNKVLPHYMLPNYFIQLESLPLDQNGKIDRKKLPDPKALRINTGSFIAPGNDTEEKLTQIWKDVLSIERLSVTDNFFDLGGNSVKIVRMVGVMNKVFAKKTAIVTAFKFPNIRELSNYLLSENEKNIQVESEEDLSMSVDRMDATMNLLNQSEDNDE